MEADLLNLENLLYSPVNNENEVLKNIDAFRHNLNNVSEIDINASQLYNTKRNVESLNSEINDEIICTTYFTSKSDPQSNNKVAEDNFDYIKPWYESVSKLGLNGIVFYDNLSLDFINKYKTDKIKFVKCVLGDYSLNDERFIIYFIFFIKHKVNNILLTDGNDVKFNKNPFELINNKNKIFIGRDDSNKIYQSKWMRESIKKFELNLNQKVPNNFFNMPLYNAGIVGGDYVMVMFFLRQISHIFYKIDKGDNNNMVALNYILFQYFYPNCRKKYYSIFDKLFKSDTKLKLIKRFKKYKLNFLLNSKINYKNDYIANSKYIFSGYPLNSGFKKYEENSNAYIIHK